MSVRRGATVLSLASVVFFGGLVAPGVASAGDDHPSREECKDLWREIDNHDDWKEWWDKCGDRFDPHDGNGDHHDKDKKDRDNGNHHDKDKKDRDNGNHHDKDKKDRDNGNHHDKDKKDRHNGH